MGVLKEMELAAPGPNCPQKSCLSGWEKTCISIAGSISILKHRYRSASSHRSQCFQENSLGEEQSCSPQDRGSQQPLLTHFLVIWTLAYSELVSSGRGAGRLGALLRCTMSRSA